MTRTAMPWASNNAAAATLGATIEPSATMMTCGLAASTMTSPAPSLRKAGNSYKGLCPFHGEKTPSFNVMRDRGFFHCFGCGVGGDVFKFLELHDKVGFPDAVKLLAQRFGLALRPGDGAAVYSNTGFFLRELFSKVIFADRQLVQQYLSPAKRRLRSPSAALPKGNTQASPRALSAAASARQLSSFHNL